MLSGSYNEVCDMWSIGVILFILLCGKPPFGGSTDDAILEKVKRGNYVFQTEHWHERSEEVKDLITKLLEKDPLKRINAK